MSIAELFYPKELKQVIADLRAKDDLNEQALRLLNIEVVTFCILWIIIFFSMVSFYSSFWVYVTLICICCFVFSLKLFEREKYLLSQNGDVVEAVINNTYYHSYPNNRSYAGWDIDYSFEIEGDVYHSYENVMGYRNLPEELQKRGAKAKVIVDPQEPEKNMLIVPALLKQYCLSKKKIKNL